MLFWAPIQLPLHKPLNLNGKIIERKTRIAWMKKRRASQRQRVRGALCVFAGKVCFVTSTKFLASNVCYPFASSLVLPARDGNGDTLLSIFLSLLYKIFTRRNLGVVCFSLSQKVWDDFFIAFCFITLFFFFFFFSIYMAA